MTYNSFDPFEWDSEKAISNFKKHGIDFYEASTIWSDANGIDLMNNDETDEIRWIRIGYSIKTRLLIAVYVENYFGSIRLISSRKATMKEQQYYNFNLKMVIL